MSSADSTTGSVPAVWGSRNLITLTGADLSGTDLSDANLSFVDLFGTDLTQAIVTVAILGELGERVARDGVRC